MATTDAYTLQQWISQFRSLTNIIGDFVSRFPISNGEHVIFYMDESYLTKYHNELEPYKTSVDLSDREKHFYAYNPRLFAYDIYGYPEFWYLVIYANELHSAMEFNLSRVKFYQASVVNVLNSIRMLEQKYRDENDQEMRDVIVNHSEVNADVLKGSIV